KSWVRIPPGPPIHIRPILGVTAHSKLSVVPASTPTATVSLAEKSDLDNSRLHAQLVFNKQENLGSFSKIGVYCHWLLKEGFKPQTIQSHNRTLRFLARNVTLSGLCPRGCV